MRNIKFIVLAWIAMGFLASCQQKKAEAPAEQTADSVKSVTDENKMKADSLAAVKAAEEAKQKNMQAAEQEIRALVTRSADDEKCFSTEYRRLLAQAEQVSEARLWNVVPGSIYEVKSVTPMAVNVESETTATAKAVLKIVDFEDETDQQTLRVILSLISENGKWVIDDVDQTKLDFMTTIKNSH